MPSNHDDVGDFHQKFDIPYGVGPRDVPDDLLDFRIDFIKEELREFEDARDAGDEAGMFDALIDMAYIIHGTAHILGYPWQEGWDEVQQANMSKRKVQPDGSDSKRGSKWDVVKPPGWTAPDMERILKEHGW